MNRAAVISLLLLALLCIADARKDGGHNSAKQAEKQAEVAQQHDAAHGHRKLKVHKDSISGRSGSAMYDPTPLAGRKLQQADVTATTVADGMTLCLPAGAQGWRVHPPS